MTEIVTEFRVEMSREARANLADIHAWIAKSAPAGADRWLKAFEEAISRLEQYPLSFAWHRRANIARRSYDRFCSRREQGRVYRAVYFVEGHTVKITHVRGPRQRLIPSDGFDLGH